MPRSHQSSRTAGGFSFRTSRQDMGMNFKIIKIRDPLVDIILVGIYVHQPLFRGPYGKGHWGKPHFFRDEPHLAVGSLGLPFLLTWHRWRVPESLVFLLEGTHEVPERVFQGCNNHPAFLSSESQGGVEHKQAQCLGKNAAHIWAVHS